MNVYVYIEIGMYNESLVSVERKFLETKSFPLYTHLFHNFYCTSLFLYMHPFFFFLLNIFFLTSFVLFLIIIKFLS